MPKNINDNTEVCGINTDGLTYENAMERLSEIVNLLEGGKLSLDESVKLFEEGARLAAFCDGCLKNAELTIKKLSEEPDEPEE